MNEVTNDFLMDYLATPSPPGYERTASEKWRNWGTPFSDTCETDSLGNSYLHLNPSAKPRVLLTAHTDELALIITHIDENGFLFFDTMGSWDLDVLPGQRVQVISASGPVLGVIGRNDLFRRSDEERNRRVRLDDLWVDIGVSSRQHAHDLVRIGDPVVLNWAPAMLSENLLVARGLDDRAGCFVVVEALRQIAKVGVPFSVSAVATVQEEIGHRGARVSTYRLNPTIAIAVDLYSTSDTPKSKDSQGRFGEISLGAGPILARGPNVSPELFDHLVHTASENDIPYQTEAEPRGTLTDANEIQLSRTGVLTCLISIPNRYSHSPIEIVDLRDVWNTVKLIAIAVEHLSDSLLEA